MIKRPLLVLSSFALSCSTATVVNTTYNLSRANDVAFVCLQTGDGHVLVDVVGCADYSYRSAIHWHGD